MGRKKEMTTVYLRPDQLRDLTALAKLDKRPRSVLIRDAFDAYLLERRLEIPAITDDPRQMPLKLTGTDS